MADNQVIKLSELKSHCQSCSLYDLCLPMGLETGDLDRLDNVIKRRQSVNKNKFLYRMGEPLKSVFALSVKWFSCWSLLIEKKCFTKTMLFILPFPRKCRNTLKNLRILLKVNI